MKERTEEKGVPADIPPLVDTHCHLEMARFDKDRDAVIERAREAGLAAMITVGSDPESNRKALALARAHEGVYAAVGIHPHDAQLFTPALREELRAWLGREKVVAVGETGLDYHYEHSPREVQREVFRAHLALAREAGLPAVIHSREATQDTVGILREAGVTKGVLHCFSGDRELLRTAAALGLYVSVAGPVTFPRAHELREAVKTIPDEYLLLETDAPYLAPVPRRGKRNEPAYVLHTAREVAALREVSLEDVARMTTLNAGKLFGVAAVPTEGAIVYKIRRSLYLNITNRCTNRCSFCVRFHSDFVKGHNLRLRREPALEELQAAIGDPAGYAEVVFCGYGEPLMRLDLVRELARWVKGRGGRVRINTNGHGNLIHGRNILPELRGLVDEVSVSLDAPDENTYRELCHPVFGGAFAGVLDFIREAKKHIPVVRATVVEAPGVDVRKCKELAAELGIPLKVRSLHEVG
jgi:TatD DNase family protein